MQINISYNYPCFLTTLIGPLPEEITTIEEKTHIFTKRLKKLRNNEKSVIEEKTLNSTNTVLLECLRIIQEKNIPIKDFKKEIHIYPYSENGKQGIQIEIHKDTIHCEVSIHNSETVDFFYFNSTQFNHGFWLSTEDTKKLTTLNGIAEFIVTVYCEMFNK